MKELVNGQLVYRQLGFVLAFIPMYITGLDGQARRMYTYSESTGFGLLNMVVIYRCRYYGNWFCFTCLQYLL